MKKCNSFILPLLAISIFLKLTCGYNSVYGQDQPDYDQIAEKIVNFVLEVQPGDIVLISGTPGELDLLGSLYIAVRKAGGEPNIEIDIPEAYKRAIMETPIEYLKTPLVYSQMQVRLIDCIISMGTETPGLMADVPEERLAVVRQANVQANNMFYKSKIRSAVLGQTGGIPTSVYAEFRGAEYNDMVSMFWKAVDVDYEALLTKGKAISGKFKPGSQVRITSNAGTDISFKIANIPARTNCGQTSENISAFESSQVWLPAGEAYACVDPGSATGKIVIPSWSFQGKSIKNLQITFANGRITKITADENAELLKERLNMSTGDKDVLSVVDIGLNPNSHPLQNSDYLSFEMSGVITVGIGNNSWAGGDVESDNGIQFHLSNSTLTVDNEIMVNEGILK